MPAWAGGNRVAAKKATAAAQQAQRHAQVQNMFGALAAPEAEAEGEGEGVEEDDPLLAEAVEKLHVVRQEGHELELLAAVEGEGERGGGGEGRRMGGAGRGGGGSGIGM
jgi:hypothetical protein